MGEGWGAAIRRSGWTWWLFIWYIAGITEQWWGRAFTSWLPAFAISCVLWLSAMAVVFWRGARLRRRERMANVLSHVA